MARRLTREGLGRLVRSEVRRLQEARVNGWAPALDEAIESLMELVVDEMADQGIVDPEEADFQFQEHVKMQIAQAIAQIMEAGLPVRAGRGPRSRTVD